MPTHLSAGIRGYVGRRRATRLASRRRRAAPSVPSAPPLIEPTGRVDSGPSPRRDAGPPLGLSVLERELRREAARDRGSSVFAAHGDVATPIAPAEA